MIHFKCQGIITQATGGQESQTVTRGPFRHSYAHVIKEELEEKQVTLVQHKGETRQGEENSTKYDDKKQVTIFQFGAQTRHAAQNSTKYEGKTVLAVRRRLTQRRY